MDKNETLDDIKHPESQQSLLNLLAVGAFLWFFLRSVYYLTGLSVTAIGIMSDFPVQVTFWLENGLSMILMISLGYVLSRNIWKKCENNSFKVKKAIVKLGVGILIVQGLQVLHGYYVSDYLMSEYTVQYMHYFDTLMGTTLQSLNTSLSWISLFILLLVFVKW